MKALVVIIACFLIAGCTSESSNTVVEIEELKFEVSQLKREIRGLKEKVKKEKVKTTSIISKTTGSSAQAAVIPTTLVPDGSHKDDPFLGPKDAPVIVMAFVDYQCRPCRAFMDKTFAKLKENYIDSDQVRYILRDFPLSTNPSAPRAAKSAHCAGEQGMYWKMHDALFEHESEVDEKRFNSIAEKIPNLDREKLERCVESGRYEKELAADIEEGQLLGVKGAPAFFVGKRNSEDSYQGIFIRGAQPYAVFDQYLQNLLG